MKRRLKRPKVRRPESILRRRRDEVSRRWLQSFDAESICSYPEDVIVESFGAFLRKKGKAVLSEEASRVVPFTTSVLDGIDVRETIRHWTEKKIYVRESGRTPGEIGVVVVIFDEDQDKGSERYPYQLTWLGEHGQESDMAFYATAPERAIVGPGVCRVTYGGFLLSYPPGSLGDVWSDPDYREAEASRRCCCSPHWTTPESGPSSTPRRSRPGRSFTRSPRASTRRSCTCRWERSLRRLSGRSA